MFEEEVLELSELRRELADIKDTVDSLRQEWEKTHADLLNNYAFIRGTTAAAEANLRDALIAHFEKTGEKKPHPKLGIRERVRAVYDENEVTKYAKSNAQDLLVLDKKKLERYVRALANDNLILGGMLGELITFAKEPTATIAKDLED